MIEEWKDIPGYEGSYQVSNLGRVKSVPRKVPYKGGPSYALLKGKIMSLSVEKDGYLVVALSKKGARKMHKVHRLVAAAFIGGEHRGLQINHIDGDKSNNSVDNLEWCSCKQNILHKFNALGYTQKDTRRGRTVTVLSDGKQYGSIKSAARALHVNPQTIRYWASSKTPKVAIS